MSYQTRVIYNVGEGQREFDLAIPYLDKTHIKVTLNGSAPFFEWVSDSRIRLTYPAITNSILKISRVTPISAAAVEFQNGATLTKEELNRAVQQLLYRLQEQDDFLNDSLDRAMVRLGDHLGVVTTPDAIMDELLRVSELGDDLLDRFRDALASIDLSAERILEQAFQLTDQAFRTDTLDGIVANTTARTDSLELRVDTITDLVDSLVNFEDGTGIATVIQNEAQERVAGDTALASTLALIGARNGANNAFVLDLNTVRVSGTESLAQRLSAITAKADDNAAKIITESTTRATAISAEAAKIDVLIARANGFDSSITAEQIARSNADGALAQTLSLLGAKNANNTAFLLDLNKVLVGPTESFTQRLNQMVATAGTNAQALVTSEATTRASQDQSLSQRIDSVGAKTDDNTAAIATEVTARTNAVSAEAAQRTALATKIAGDIAAAVLTETNARVAADQAEAQARQSLAVQVGQNSTAIQNESTARANADGAIAQQFAVLGAFRNNQSVFTLDLNRVEVGPGWTLGTRLSGIDTSIGNVSASVVDERTARINADGALSQSIQNVQNTVGAHTASITTLSEVTNGLNARWSIALNSNGHITGITANNNGSYGTLAFVADEMSFVAPGGGDAGQDHVAGQRPGALQLERRNLRRPSRHRLDQSHPTGQQHRQQHRSRLQRRNHYPQQHHPDPHPRRLDRRREGRQPHRHRLQRLWDIHPQRERVVRGRRAACPLTRQRRRDRSSDRSTERLGHGERHMARRLADEVPRPTGRGWQLALLRPNLLQFEHVHPDCDLALREGHGDEEQHLDPWRRHWLRRRRRIRWRIIWWRWRRRGLRP